VWVGSVDRFKVREKKEGWMDLLAEKWSWQFRPLDCMPMFSKEGAKGYFINRMLLNLEEDMIIMQNIHLE
jgi:hypothetical protein